MVEWGEDDEYAKPRIGWLIVDGNDWEDERLRIFHESRVAFVSREQDLDVHKPAQYVSRLGMRLHRPPRYSSTPGWWKGLRSVVVAEQS